MNDLVVKKWVDALRSGKYAQTTEKLADENSYCCLGVLSELYCETVKPIKTIREIKEYYCDGEPYTNVTVLYEGESEVLPKTVMEWAGLETNDGAFRTSDNKIETLASLNDTGKTFAQIADIIESKPANLFV